MNPELSIIICSHNPRVDYLTRVLDALKAQTLPMEQWELLLIDNASADPIAPRFDLAWHPNARHVREDELGLTPARLRGIKEAVGEVLVFVDDDNVLGNNYLFKAMQIASSHQNLGAWGAGAIDPEFEVDPESWAMPYVGRLALRHNVKDYWSNNIDDWLATPVGAGLCVRASVAALYSKELEADSERRSFDRKGELLNGGGDLDLVFTGRKIGIGWGCFCELRIQHLIPKSRLTKEYLLRATSGSAESNVTLARRTGRMMPRPLSKLRLLIQSVYAFRANGFTGIEFLYASEKGIKKSLDHLKK